MTFPQLALIVCGCLIGAVAFFIAPSLLRAVLRDRRTNVWTDDSPKSG